MNFTSIADTYVSTSIQTTVVAACLTFLVACGGGTEEQKKAEEHTNQLNAQVQEVNSLDKEIFSKHKLSASVNFDSLDQKNQEKLIALWLCKPQEDTQNAKADFEKYVKKIENVINGQDSSKANWSGIGGRARAIEFRDNAKIWITFLETVEEQVAKSKLAGQERPNICSAGALDGAQ